MRQRDELTKTAAIIVRIGTITNRLLLAAIVAGLLATWLAPEFFQRLLSAADPAADVAQGLQGLRLLMVIGIAMTIATDRLLVPLGAIVASAGAGDPFVAANARRLQTIGWALLALQLLDVPAALLARYWPSLGSAAPNGDFSVGGWIATLMVFVLARVFAAGSAMRDDLEGTV